MATAVAQKVPEATHCLKGIDQLPLDATRIGALHGVARYLGMNHSPATVYGATGHAFLININKILCPSGPLVWRRERFDALVRNLGIEARYLGFFTADASRAERLGVEAELRAALAAGLPCALWNDEFQIITGCDSEGFDLIGPFPHHLSRRLTSVTWREWRKTYAYFYIYSAVAPAPRLRLVRESLEFAWDMYRNSAHYAENDDYGIGPDAYRNWLVALERRGATFGHEWNAKVWAECRAYAARYLREVGTWFPNAAPLTERLARVYEDISGQLGAAADQDSPTEDKRRCILTAEAREAEAVDGLRELLDRLPS